LLDDTPNLGGTGKSDRSSSFRFLSHPIIIVVIVVEIKELRFSIIASDDCLCSHGCQEEYLVICPFVVVRMSELRNVAPPGFGKGRFRGSYRGRHRDNVGMVLRFRVLLRL
jgi:hypothetical protein